MAPSMEETKALDVVEKGNGPTNSEGRKARLSQTRRGTKFVKDGPNILVVPDEKTGELTTTAPSSLCCPRPEVFLPSPRTPSVCSPADANILGYLDRLKGCLVLLRWVRRGPRLVGTQLAVASSPALHIPLFHVPFHDTV